MKKFSWILFSLLFVVACKNDITTLSELKTDFYEYREKPLHMGDTLQIKFGANEDKIDSVILTLNGKDYKNPVVLDFNNATLGLNPLQMKVYVDGSSIFGEVNLPVLSGEKETEIQYEIVKEYPHSTELFTQGFFYHNNKIYESAGLYQKSRLVTYSLGATSFSQEVKQDNRIFSEGIALLNNKIYMLTYRERKILVFDPTNLSLIQTLEMPTQMREGWGITSNGKELIMSDGTQNIFFFDENLNLVRRIQVAGYVSIYTNINELEYIEDRIYANVWGTNYILVINPENGMVEQYFDLSKISETKGSDDVLNGIAQYGSHLLVTGKTWSKIYEVARK